MNFKMFASKFKWALSLFFLLLELVQYIDSFVVCSSINIQGSTSIARFKKIRNCNIVIGYVRILNAQFDTQAPSLPNQTVPENEIFFPNLVEITDYLLIFQAQQLQSLERLFPRLAIVRGDKLFKNYALIIFLTNSLLQINLKSLVSINRGSVLFSRLYHTCYVSTIDWEYLIQDKSVMGTKPTMTLVKNDCLTQACPSECRTNGSSIANCWNGHTCQLKCSTKCSGSCNLENVNECCSNKMCLNCNNDASCIGCRKFRNLITGQCEANCPEGMLEYNSHSCIKLTDCSSLSSTRRSLIKSHHILNYTKCVKECPDGYRPMLTQLNEKQNASVCMECTDRICKRDCSVRALTLRTKEDLKMIRNCFRVKSLHIELRYNVSHEALLDSLKHLEEIEEYLVVVRNQHLGSLSFFQKLKSINGKRLYEKKFALFVHTNSVLRELFNNVLFEVKQGTVKFFENPELCYSDIETFLQDAGSTTIKDSEVSFNFNGYRRFTCSNQTIDLEIKLISRQIQISWNVTISDLRRLKGFIVSYAEIPDSFTINQNDIDFMQSYRSISSDLNSFIEWSYLYAEYNEDVKSKRFTVRINAEPFTRYAIYVKADLTHDSRWETNRGLFRSSIGFDKVISTIQYVYSLPAQPSRATSINYELVTSGSVSLKWEAPVKPNGIISFYFITYSKLDDWEQLPTVSTVDSCQFVNTYKESTETVTATTIATTTTTETQKQRQKSADMGSSCQQFNAKTYRKASLRLDDHEKNDIISIEDEIYNLAFRPARRKWLEKKVVARSLSDNGTFENAFIEPADSYEFSPEKILQEKLYDMDESLMGLVKQDLFVKKNEKFPVIITSNETLYTHISNLTSFDRYIVSIIACQNFTTDLIDFAKNLAQKRQSRKSKQEIIDHLSMFGISRFCSKPSLTTFRSLAQKSLDQVTNVSFTTESGVSVFKWSPPVKPNGFIYKYNLKFVDVNLNKTQGPLCYSDLNVLKVSLNQFLLTEGHEYLIQVQAVTSAGPGPWSNTVDLYKVPSLSRQNLLLIFEIMGSVLATSLILLITCLSIKNYIRFKNRKYFGINSHYYYFRPDEWEIKREDILIEERIGSGCYAEVHRGKMKLGDEEAIDCAIKFCGSDDQNRQRILKEANMMKSINTTHIVKLLGIVSIDNPAYLILEFMEKGDLKEYLKNAKIDSELRAELTVSRLYRIAAEIADGMLWLSEHKYIHRDLAARNCLISKGGVIKIADLGLSKDIYQNPIYREKCKSLLPIRWMSPESLLDGSSTTKSDVWSYGVVIWELSTLGDNPYAGKENESVIKFVTGGGKLELAQTAPAKFQVLLGQCMMFEDHKRTGFKEILDTLDPDLKADFKKKAFYHNEFKSKLTIKRSKLMSEATVKIANPTADIDNYM